MSWGTLPKMWWTQYAQEAANTRTQPMAVQCTGEDNKHLWMLCLCQTPLNLIMTDYMTAMSCWAPTQYAVPSFSQAQSTLTAVVLGEHLFCNRIHKGENRWICEPLLMHFLSGWPLYLVILLFKVYVSNLHMQYCHPFQLPPSFASSPFLYVRRENCFSEVHGKSQEATGPSCSKATFIWISGNTSCPQEWHSHGTGPREVVDLHLWGLSTFSGTQPQITRSSSGVQTSRQGCRDTSPPKFFCESKLGKTDKQNQCWLCFLLCTWINGTDPLILWDRPPKMVKPSAKLLAFLEWSLENFLLPHRW